MHKVPSPRAFTENNKNKNSKDDDCDAPRKIYIHVHTESLLSTWKRKHTDICGGRRPGDWLSRCSAPYGAQEAGSAQKQSLNKWKKSLLHRMIWKFLGNCRSPSQKKNKYTHMHTALHMIVGSHLPKSLGPG